ncbi:hypothetical protein KQY27_00225 [Methanobrevibacter sp. TMH8]|uniref:hypothetical protein n=1 Tax=Methanobrevibacter sp. TMH8 TaxID=2848611 RepID=UPI001CCA1731|nr:hypothetical protein [Methanobrevibacter sp. TMH8]MBZ9569984.1 hypothetical protein [Methanobrevibacter sp. TMH8]
MKHDNSTLEPLTTLIPYRRRVWITGFLKTTINSGLIATGIVSIFAGIIDHPLLRGYHEIGIIVGSVAIGLAIIIIYFIDYYDEKKKKEELNIIDTKIEKKAKEVARELVDNELEKILEECK